MKRIYQKESWIALALIVAMSACGKSDDVAPEIPPSDGSVMTLEGGDGGNAAENAVYVDFSAENQVPVKRDSWDLALYTGDEFQVKLNNMIGAAAIATGETDLNAVNSENFDISTLAVGQGQGTLDMIDAVDGSIEGTVIAPIAEDETANKVYVISTAGGTEVLPENVYKVRVLRSDNGGYAVQYAQIDENSFNTIEVEKNADYNFSYASFKTGDLVSVEPDRTNWDIVWGYSMYYTANFPYPFSDLVFINHLGGVTAAEVLVEDGTSYEDFAENHLGAITWSNDIDVIGSKWRVTSPEPARRLEDRFYVIKDAAGNVYKLKFNSMGPGDSGERGRPEIEFQLVTRG
ncbi:hypothetical protein H8S90_07685 [Olivibacter sp. SDN3]|uniref:HmuY family protein n=1 Tax=Olivibacter sp. SDN3 TaxID=2764720 RepID=UPI001651A9F7|nr:HmuY family protein [Olivibacter sp. SDN3]QNL51447.1 hypothetical protein H8S90_07685 [Olivibacter sp. SDN3]